MSNTRESAHEPAPGSALKSSLKSARNSTRESNPESPFVARQRRTALTRRQACGGKLLHIDEAIPELPAELVTELVAEPPGKENPVTGAQVTVHDASPAEPAYLPLSRTTDRVLRTLLDGDLSRVRAESVAEGLGISCTTLRRRLRQDHTSYQFLLDRARQYRCESRLRDRWLPGKCLADELGYLEVNSFYRAFKRWTGLSYSEYKLTYH